MMNLGPRTPLRNSSFKRKEYIPPASAPLRKLDRTPNYSGSTSGVAVVKTQPKRNRALLDMAKGRPCLLWVAHEPLLDGRTTVACHSNLSIHGKAGARKADDQYSVWGCAACHEWLDRGPALAQEKEAAFMAAHLRQVIEWRYMATAMHEPARFRKAAQWALDQLAATPIGETV